MSRVLYDPTPEVVSRRDPGEWSPYSAAATVIGVDYGYAADHSAIVVAGRWLSSMPIIGVAHVQQLPLRTSVQELIEAIRAVASNWVVANVPSAVVFDARSNAAVWHQLIHAGVPGVVGASLTGAAHHGNRPDVRPVAPPDGGRPVPAAEYSLSRTQLFDDLVALVHSDAGKGALCDPAG